MDAYKLSQDIMHFWRVASMENNNAGSIVKGLHDINVYVIINDEKLKVESVNAENGNVILKV
jgi:hypothetical protein